MISSNLHSAIISLNEKVEYKSNHCACKLSGGIFRQLRVQKGLSLAMIFDPTTNIQI